MKTVIMAGGKGTRIASVARDIPKPMIPIAGKPILQREVECLEKQGFRDIILTVSYLGSVIEDYFGDGSKFGVRLEYFHEEQPLGNAGALFLIREKLTEDFLLLNADALFDVDFHRFWRAHQKNRKRGGIATLFTHPNDHPYDSGLLVTDCDGRIKKWLTKEDERPRYYKNRVNAGLHAVSPEVLDRIAESGGASGKVDLDRQIWKPLTETGKLFCYDSSEYVKDMGTPERYAKVCRDFEQGIIEKKNLKRKQRAIFLDRDGTINRYVGFLRKSEELELLPGAAEAIRRINESGYLAIVVTNQPVVARGETTTEELAEIHNKMETLLGEQGAYLDAIYYCPHHPDKGFPGEVESLKIECECRKPKPGMLLRAAEEWNIDLKQSWMVGDGKNDVKAGKSAGCRTILLGEDEYRQDFCMQSLGAAVQCILEKGHL